MPVEEGSTTAAREGVGSAVARFAALGGGFFRERRRLSRRLVLALAGLGLAQIAVQLLLNMWSGAIFDAIEQRDVAAMLRQVAVFAGLAASFLGLFAWHIYAKMRMQVAWREWVTERLLEDWLAPGRARELAIADRALDNPDQRIAEDVRLASEGAVDLADGLFHAVLSLGCFVGLLWTLSHTLTFAVWPGVTVELPGYLVWAAFGYAAIGTLFTWLLGRALVPLNQARLSNEADFRFGLASAREEIGASRERTAAQRRREVLRRFGRVIATWRLLMLRTRRLSFLTAGYAVIATGFPVLIAAPQYFAQLITLGGLMQATAAFVTVQQTLSWFVDNFQRFADWSASVHRIHALRAALDLSSRRNASADETLGRDDARS